MCAHAPPTPPDFPSCSTQAETFSTQVDTNRIETLILFPSLADQAESLLVECEYYIYIYMYVMSVSSVAGLSVGCSWPPDPRSPQLLAPGHMSPQGPQPGSSYWCRANWSSGKSSCTAEQAVRELQAGQKFRQSLTCLVPRALRSQHKSCGL